MKLERARELYSDYAEGALSPAMALALEQHFASDPAARADYDAFKRVYALLDTAEVPMVDVPMGFRAKIMELAAEEQSRRANAPAPRAAATLTGWFQSLTRTQRRATGGFATALAALAIFGVIIGSVRHGVTDIGGLWPQPSGGSGTTVAASLIPTTIQGVSTQPGTDGNTYHLFDVHLPPSVPAATVTAYVVTATDEITDPTTRAAQATPALRQPQHLTNDESMQIPVALLRDAPAGTTLNVLVLWTPDNGGTPGAQVVFTPVGGPGAPMTTAGGYYEALQAIASQYQVSVVADASVLGQSVPPVTPGATVQAALAAVANSVGAHVRQLPNGAYQVYR